MNLKIYDIIKKLQNFKLSPDQFGLMYLAYHLKDTQEYIVKNKIPYGVIKELVRREFITFLNVENKPFNLEITEFGRKIIQTIEMLPIPIKTYNNISTEIEEISSTLKKFKEADLEWMYYWREDYMKHKNGVGGSVSDCINKMKKFLKTNPDVSPELIIKATNAYVNSIDNLKYLRKADYFIFKQYNGSLLEEWIEVVQRENTPTDWKTNSIN